jgi:hypothetical protein
MGYLIHIVYGRMVVNKITEFNFRSQGWTLKFMQQMLRFLLEWLLKAIPLKAWTDACCCTRLTISEFLDNRQLSVIGFQPYVPAAFTPQDIFLVLISVRDLVDPQGHSATGSQWKIEPATFQLAVPQPNVPPRTPFWGIAEQMSF